MSCSCHRHSDSNHGHSHSHCHPKSHCHHESHGHSHSHCHHESHGHSHSHCKKNPDFVFFYSSDINDNGTKINQRNLGDSVIETMIANLTDSKSEKIGKLLSLMTSYDITKNTNIKFPALHNDTYFFPNGSINITIPKPTRINPQKKFTFPAGLKIVIPISSGTGIYLNKKGFVVIHTEEYKRKVEIFLKK